MNKFLTILVMIILPLLLKSKTLIKPHNKQTKNTEADPIGEFNGELLKGELSNV